MTRRADRLWVVEIKRGDHWEPTNWATATATRDEAREGCQSARREYRTCQFRVRPYVPEKEQ